MTDVLIPTQEEVNVLNLSDEQVQHRLVRAQLIRAEAFAKLAQLKLARDQAEHAPVLEFFSDTDEEDVEPCIITLGNWSRAQPGVPIEIIMNSPGGTVTGGMSLYEYLLELRSRGHRITIKVMGAAASMAGVILQAADVRLIGANSWFMLHEVSGADLGKVSEMEDELATTKRMQAQLIEILSSRSLEKPGGLDAEAIQKLWHKTDVWLTAEEALALHFVDGIINAPAKSKSTPKQTSALRSAKAKR